MIYVNRYLLVFLVIGTLAMPLHAQQYQQMSQLASRTNHGFGMHIIATSEVAAELSVGGEQERITGRVSMHLVTTPAGMREGQVMVLGFNVAFFGVPQRLLARDAPTQEPLGVLAFGVVPDKTQALHYDAKTGRLAGELRMFADASFLSTFAKPAEDGKGDLFLTPTLLVTATIALDLEKPLPERGVEYQRIQGKLDVNLNAERTQYEKFEFRGFNVQLHRAAFLDLEIAPLYFFEVAQRLCVQPVRLLRFRWTEVFPYRWTKAFPLFPFFLFSGAGLPFGEPGARTEWRKADVVFNIRDWKTVWASTYWEMDSTEAAGLLAQVDDDDCIEVFFPYDFDPDALWGGGATFGSGTASSKIISSDGNARGGIDLTHLAHELGHVLGLRHPGAAATASAVPASSGTLMCPSGYLNDNPKVNSQENKNLISNPLLTFAIKFISPGPDCINSADCGACP